MKGEANKKIPEGNEKGKGVAYNSASGIEGGPGMRGCYMPPVHS